MNPVTTIQGDGPILLGQPHSGTFVPDSIWSNLTETGQKLLDTDWHIPDLYDGLVPDATIVRANFSRYVIDPNRAPDGDTLYQGHNTTELVPLTTFDAEPLWKTAPDTTGVENRLEGFHAPYHAAMRQEIERIKAIHGFAILYDCHSIRSRIPHLFEGRLPDLNIGDNGGASCAPAITLAIAKACGEANAISHVVNGRFKGGWTTRHYGRPDQHVHAIQMEICQRLYLRGECLPFEYDPERAEPLRQVLKTAFNAIHSLIDTENFRDQKND